MEILFDGLPYKVSWNDWAVAAMGANIEAICEMSDKMLDYPEGSVITGSTGIIAKVSGLPEGLSLDQMKAVAKTIARFLQFHNVHDSLAEYADIKLEEGLEVVFLNLTEDKTLIWQDFKELV